MKRFKKIVGIFFLIEFVVSIFATFPILTDHPFVAIGTCSFLGGISFLLLHQPRKPETQFVIILKKVVLCIMGTIFALSGIGGILGCTVALNVPTVIFFIIFSVVFFALGIVCFHSALKKHTIPIPEDANSQTDNCCQTTDFVATENTLPDNVEEMHTNCVPLEMPAANEKVGLADAEEMTVEDQASDAHKNASSDTPPVSYIEDGSSIYRTDGKPISDEEVPYLMQLGYEEALQKKGLYKGQLLDLSFVNKDLQRKKAFTAMPSYEDLCNIPVTYDTSALMSTDIFFLKYIDGRTLENPNIAQYWYYDYGLNYSDEIKKLISAGLLKITNINLTNFKVEDLKNILRHFNLPLSGKKEELQKRILENIKLDELYSFLGNSTHYFSATDSGNNFIHTIHDSAIFYTELEDEAISLIMKDNYQAAYSLIWTFKVQNPTQATLNTEYPQYMDTEYHSIMNSRSFFYTLEKDRELEFKIRAAVIFCRMYGSGQDKIKKIIKRIYIENGHEFTNDAKNIIDGRLL